VVLAKKKFFEISFAAGSHALLQGFAMGRPRGDEKNYLFNEVVAISFGYF
jgi:hypothetical protein